MLFLDRDLRLVEVGFDFWPEQAPEHQYAKDRSEGKVDEPNDCQENGEGACPSPNFPQPPADHWKGDPCDQENRAQKRGDRAYSRNNAGLATVDVEQSSNPARYRQDNDSDTVFKRNACRGRW